MDQLTQVIERRHSNGTVSVTITKEHRKDDPRFKIHMLEENYTTTSGRSLYSNKEHTFYMCREELMDLRVAIEKGLLFLEAKW